MHMSWTLFLLCAAALVLVIAGAGLFAVDGKPDRLPVTDAVRRLANSEVGCVAFLIFATGMAAIPLGAWFGIPAIARAVLPVTAPYIGAWPTWILCLVIFGGLAITLFSYCIVRLDHLGRAIKDGSD
jgi:hypothetical protein